MTAKPYIDPDRTLQWGEHSSWAHPWRSYLDTWPAQRLQDALGMNAVVATRAHAENAYRMLAEHGIRRVRFELGFSAMKYGQPGVLQPADVLGLEGRVAACGRWGIRPLITVYAPQGNPCPRVATTLRLLEPIDRGDTTARVAPADLPKITVGKTGITEGGFVGRLLFMDTADDGTVKLSRPAQVIVPAGTVQAVTLMYAPIISGPWWQESLNGWIDYCLTVAREMKRILGSEEFDVEIWNEPANSSGFVTLGGYYDPKPVQAPGESRVDLIQATVTALRAAHPDIGITNGFASQDPAWSGSEAAVGLTALSKHPYKGRAWLRPPVSGWHLNAQQVVSERPKLVVDTSFGPTAVLRMPEFALEGIETWTLTHDLSPWPVNFGHAFPTPTGGYHRPVPGESGRFIHGRDTHPPGGEAPGMWITEHGFGWEWADTEEIKAKVALRLYVAYVSKGVEAVYPFAAFDRNYGYVNQTWIDEWRANPAVMPTADPGLAVAAIGRLSEAMEGEEITEPRALTLEEWHADANRTLIAGNGTPQFPDITSEDMLLFAPFQASDTSFVVGVYVITPDFGAEFDPVEFELTIGGVDGRYATAAAEDPLTGEVLPVAVLGGTETTVKVRLAVSDYPRLLTVVEHVVPPRERARIAGEAGLAALVGEAFPEATRDFTEAAAAAAQEM